MGHCSISRRVVWSLKGLSLWCCFLVTMSSEESLTVPSSIQFSQTHHSWTYEKSTLHSDLGVRTTALFAVIITSKRFKIKELMTWPQHNLLGISSHSVWYRKVTDIKVWIQKADNQKYVDAGQTSKSYVQSFKSWQTGICVHCTFQPLLWQMHFSNTNLKKP